MFRCVTPIGNNQSDQYVVCLHFSIVFIFFINNCKTGLSRVTIEKLNYVLIIR